RLWEKLGRRTDADNYVPINVKDDGNWDGDLMAGLDSLLSANKTFERVVFTAHGDSDPGQLKIGGQHINRWDWGRLFNNRNYHKLFQPGTLWYFNGCAVAEGDDGTRFLAAAGGVFLRNGGTIFGDTTLGLMVDDATTGFAAVALFPAGLLYAGTVA